VGSPLPEVLYGRRKMTAWLDRNGFPDVSTHTADRLMHDEGNDGSCAAGAPDRDRRNRSRLNEAPA